MHRHLIPDVLEKILDDVKGFLEDEEYYQLSVYSFPQMWGSTAIGLGDVGGQAITTVPTTVVEADTSKGYVYYVFFSSHFAYKVERPNKKLMEDIRKQRMARVSERGKYERKRWIGEDDGKTEPYS